MSATVPPASGLLIGLTAPAGSGKSLVGAMLEEHYSFVSFGLADPILNMVCELALEVDEGCEWAIERSLKERPMPVLGRSYRELAQTLGDWGRAFEPGFWLRLAEHKLGQARVRGENVCVLDIRYPNEAAWLRQHHGLPAECRVVQQRGGAAQRGQEDAQPAPHPDAWNASIEVWIRSVSNRTGTSKSKSAVIISPSAGATANVTNPVAALTVTPSSCSTLST